MSAVTDTTHDAEHAAESVGLNLPATQPFAGLCSIDPQHGAATSSPDGDGLCRACIAAIGTEAREAIKAFVGMKTTLKLWVKVVPGWTEDPNRVRELAIGDDQ